MSGIGSWVYQIALLLAATFAFMVLFQYGTRDFGQHAKAEMMWLKGLVSRRGADSSGTN